MTDKTLILSSCGALSVDQMAIDLICFNFCSQIGRLISDNVDFLASQNPFNPESKVLASAIDVYAGDLPALGSCIVLRVAVNLPDVKRQILDYAKEICEFSEPFKRVILLRSVPSVFGTDTQISDWPDVVRGFGSVTEVLKMKSIEDYDESQEMLKAAVFGEFFECLRRFMKVDFSAVLIFVHKAAVVSGANALAAAVSGKSDLKAPPSWDTVFC